MQAEAETWEGKLQRGLMGKVKAAFRWGTAGRLVKAAQFMDQADHCAAQKPQRAVKFYNKAIDLLARISEEGEARPQLLGAALLRRGRLLEEMGEQEEALNSYLLAREYFATLPEPVVDFITLHYVREGRFDEEVQGFYLDFLKAHRQGARSPEVREVHTFLERLAAVGETDRGKRALERLTLNKRLLQADANLEWAHYHAGMASLLLKKYEEAVNYFRRAKDLRAPRPDLDFYLALARGLDQMQKEQWEPAVAPLRAATGFSPGRADAWQALGWTLLNLAGQTGAETEEGRARLAEAVSSLEKAAALAPERADYAFAWGRALELAGDLAGAVAALRRAVQLAPQARYYLPLGLALKKSGALEEAREAAAKALELSQNSYPEPQSLAAIHRLLGEIYFERGELERAEAEFKQVLEYVPEDASAREDLGITLFRLHRFSEAIPLLEPVAAGSQRARFPLARALAQIDDHQAAVAWLERLTAAAPAEAQAFYYLGLGYAHLGRFEEAGTALDRAIGLDSSRAEAFFQRGHVRVKLGHWDAAGSDYQQAQRLDPENPEISYHLGCLRRQEGKAEEAIHQFSQAVQRNPEHLPALLALGELYEKAGRLAEAQEAYETAAALSPGNPAILQHLGVLHWRQGALDQAATRLREAGAAGDESDALAYCQGQVALARRELPLALEAWETLSARHPEDGALSHNLQTLHYLLGQEHLKAGRLAEAIQEWEECRELGAGAEALRANLGGLYFRVALRELATGRPASLEAAAAALEQAVTLDRDNYYYQYYRALARLAQKRGAEFQDAVAGLLDRLEPRTRVHARYHQAIAWLEAGEWEKAAKLLEDLSSQMEPEGVTLDPTAVLALIKARAGLWPEAVQLLSPAALGTG